MSAAPLRVQHGPLVVVSNRLPYDLPRRGGLRATKRNVGGLVNAVEPVLSAIGGAWVGWDGASLPSASAVTDALGRPNVSRTPTGVEIRGAPLSEREIALYYHGFSNRGIWPLFHDFPGKTVFEPEAARVYERVNRRFAEIAFEMAGPRGRIWVHDFHLMRVPGILRELGFAGRIDFFLHIPFPPAEIFRALPPREAVLESLLSADTVGFHVARYRDNFAESARVFLGAETETTEEDRVLHIRNGARACAALSAPIGIDVDAFERLAASPKVAARAQRIRDAHRDRKILFGVDRLDYTKGIRERIAAFERVISMHSRLQKAIVLVLVVVPSRNQVEENRLLKREIDREIGRVNGEFGRVDWAPIHYIYHALDREELVAYYRASDVALVTPLRDGMNLVAAEYPACRLDESGVLVVSEFAGIAERSPGAILVNPYDMDSMAESIRIAAEMSPAEQTDRMRRLRDRVRSNPVMRWADRCLAPEILPEPRLPAQESSA